jgi:hypothetical protein
MLATDWRGIALNQQVGARRETAKLYVVLLVPIALFVISLFIRPQMTFDTAQGFIVLRSMLAGGAFNYLATPDPANIDGDIGTFLTWWSPGQYLVPGAFVSLGASYGLAMSLTTLLATLIGVFGWIRIALSFDIPRTALFLFALGLVTFSYATVPFAIFNGGDVVLFAVLPWSLWALQWATRKPAAISFAITVLSAVLLFIAKLSGVIVFAATVAGISVVEIWTRRRLGAALLAMWAGGAVAALLFITFWLTRGATPAGAARFVFSGPVIWFPVAAAAFSGFSALNCLDDFYLWVSLHSSAPALSDIAVNGYASYALGPLGLLLIGWVWFRLRGTRYRPLAVSLLTIITFYIAAYVLMYARNGTIVSFEERYFYYAGIPFFMLLLIAADQWRSAWARAVPILAVGLFAIYGVTAYAHEAMRNRHYDSASGTAMLVVPPGVLGYLRSEMAVHNWTNAIAVVPQPEAAVGLPRFRILFSWQLLESSPLEDIFRQRWAGRVDKIFVILNKAMLGDGKADAVLKTFVDYDFAKWQQMPLDGMVVFSQ